MNEIEQNERMAIVETKIDGMTASMVEIKDALKDHVKWEQDYHEEDLIQRNEDWTKIMTKFDTLEFKLDKKYAPKWTEWAVKTLIGASIVAVISTIINVII